MSSFDNVINRRGTNSKKWDQDGIEDGDIVLSIADMDLESPDCAKKAVLEIVQRGIFGYPKSIDMYKATVCSYLQREEGWNVSEDSIFFVPSILKAISILVRAFTKEGDSILIHLPCYAPFMEIPNSTNRKLVYSNLQTDGNIFSMNLNEMEEQFKEHRIKMCIFCNPHNPTGRVWRKEELQAFVALCKKHNVIIISDEIHCEVIMPSHKFTRLASIDTSYKDSVFTLRSPSKTYNLAGIRIGYIINESDHVQKKLKDFMLYHNEKYSANIFAGPVLKSVYEDGKNWKEEMLYYCHENYQMTLSMFSGFKKFVIYPLEGTYLMWIQYIGDDLEEDDMKRLLKEHNIVVEYGSDFGLQNGVYLRINIATSKYNLQKALLMLEKAIYKI